MKLSHFGDSRACEQAFHFYECPLQIPLTLLQIVLSIATKTVSSLLLKVPFTHNLITFHKNNNSANELSHYRGINKTFYIEAR